MYSTSVHANCYHGLKTNMRLFCWGVHSLWEQCPLFFLRLHTPTHITFSSLISTGNGYWSASWMKWQWQLFRTDNSPHWVITTSKGTQPLCNQPYTSRSFIYFWMNKYQLEKSPLNSFLTSRTIQIKGPVTRNLKVNAAVKGYHECRFAATIQERYNVSKRRGERGNALRPYNERGQLWHLQKVLVDELWLIDSQSNGLVSEIWSSFVFRINW